MTTIKIKLEGDERVIKALRRTKGGGKARENFLKRTGFAIEKEWKERAPVDVGRYRASISTQLKGDTSVAVGSNVKYAPEVEFGRKPGKWPPKGSLQPWARRHGFPAGSSGDFLVRRVIFLRGTKAVPAMRDALKATQGKIKGFVRLAAKELGIDWGKK